MKPGYGKAAMGIKRHTARPRQLLRSDFLHAAGFHRHPCDPSIASLVAAAIGNLGFMSPAMSEPAALTKKQSDALDTYNNAVRNSSRSWASGARRSIRSSRCRTCRDRRSTSRATT